MALDKFLIMLKSDFGVRWGFYHLSRRNKATMFKGDALGKAI